MGYIFKKPTKSQLEESYGIGLPDVLKFGLKLVFCGINPGLYSAYTGHHFARPGNRFWPALYKSGFTERIYSPYEDYLLLEKNMGLTNIVDKATARSEQLTKNDLKSGMELLIKKIEHFKPEFLAILGISAYKDIFEIKEVKIGLQPEKLGGATVWVLPSPSGLNAHFTLPNLTAEFIKLREYCCRK